MNKIHEKYYRSLMDLRKNPDEFNYLMFASQFEDLAQNEYLIYEHKLSPKSIQRLMHHYSRKYKIDRQDFAIANNLTVHKHYGWYKMIIDHYNRTHNATLKYECD